MTPLAFPQRKGEPNYQDVVATSEGIALEKIQPAKFYNEKNKKWQQFYYF